MCLKLAPPVLEGRIAFVNVRAWRRSLVVMRSRARAWCFAAGVGCLAVLACDDSTAPGGPVSGRWRTDSALSTLGATIDVALTQKDSVIEGRGSYIGVFSTEVVVIGHYASSLTATPVILTFSGVNIVPAVLFGRLSANGDTLSGEYRWGFGALPPDTVTFIRY